MKVARRTVLLGLAGFGLPIIAASCTNSANSTGTGSTTESSSAQVGSPASTPDKIRIGYQVIPNGELLAKALGLAAKAFPNSQIQYISFDSGRDVNTAIAANGIDFGLAGSVPVSVGIAQGLPYKVYFIHDVIGAAEALVVRRGISSAADLKGKKIATPFGSTAHFSLESFLKQEGIDQSELTILDLQPPDIVAAWQRGDIDGSYVWQPNLSRLTGDGGTLLVTSADLAEKGVLTADIGVVRTAFAEQYPDVVKQYVGVLDEAIAYYRSSPDDAIKALAGELNISPEETASAVKELIWLDSDEQKDAKYLGTPGSPGEFANVLKQSADFVVEQKTIPSAPDLAVYQAGIYAQAL